MQVNRINSCIQLHVKTVFSAFKNRSAFVKTIFSGISLIAISGSFSLLPQNDHSLARVYRTDDKMAFFCNEPVNNYSLVFSFKDTLQNYNCLTPEQIVSSSLKKAIAAAATQGKTFDAIVIETPEEGMVMAITFSDKTKDNSIARVKRTEGKFLFTECEPLFDYDVIDKFAAAEKAKEITKGKCPTHQERIDRLHKKADRIGVNYDAIVFSSSKYDLIIRFKQ